MDTTRRRRAEILVLLGALAAMGPVAVDMYVPALPEIADDLGASAASTQLTLTAFFVGLGIGQLVAGPPSDVIGRRPPLLVCVAVYAAAGAVCAVAPSLPVLVGARLVQGVAAAAGIVVSRAIVRDLYVGKALARSYSRMYLVIGLAPMLAPLVGAQVLRVTSWRGVFVALAGFGIVLLAAATARLPETLPAAGRRPSGIRATARTLREVARHRGLVGFALTLGCATAAFVAAAAGAPFVVQTGYGESPQAYGLLVFAGGAGIVAANQLSARLVRTLGAEQLLGAGLATTTLAGLGLLVVGGRGVWPFAACFVCLFASFGLIVPNATALALRDQVAVAGAAAAFLGLVQYGTGALAAPLAGVAGGGRVVPLGIVVTSFALAGSLGAALTIGWERRQRASGAA